MGGTSPTFHVEKNPCVTFWSRPRHSDSLCPCPALLSMLAVACRTAGTLLWRCLLVTSSTPCLLQRMHHPLSLQPLTSGELPGDASHLTRMQQPASSSVVLSALSCGELYHKSCCSCPSLTEAESLYCAEYSNQSNFQCNLGHMHVL